MTPTYSDSDITYRDTVTLGSTGVTAGFSTSMGAAHAIPAFIPRDQLIFWTRAWREGEEESAAAREAGNTREFASGTEAVRWLLSDD